MWDYQNCIASYHIQNITACTDGKIYTLHCSAYDILPLLAFSNPTASPRQNYRSAENTAMLYLRVQNRAAF